MMFFSREIPRKKCVSIIFTPEKLFLFYLDAVKNNLEFHAYQAHSYQTPHSNLYVYNMPEIKTVIEQFLAEHECKKANLFFGVYGSPITQKIIACNQISDINAIPLPYAHTHQSGTQYLYPTEQNTHIFYAWSAPHSLIFQLQLVAHALKKPSVAIMPRWSCLFQLYKQWYFPVFRQLQFAQDMENSNRDITAFFTPETCYRLLNCKTSFKEDEYSHLLHAAGIIYSYKELI